MNKKLSNIDEPFDWTYHVTVKVRDKLLILKKLDNLLLGFVRNKWIRDFDVHIIDSTIIVTFSGRTISNGVPTVYPHMVWDKVVYLIEGEIGEHRINTYSYTARIDNIEEAKKTLQKAGE